MKRFVIEIPGGYRSREAASFVSQLDNLHRDMREALQDITVDELGWQPAPGMNTIGMLLAHLAIVEVHWMNIGVLDVGRDRVVETLGLREPDDGIPLAPAGLPPEHLASKDLAYFMALIDTARAYRTKAALALTDADMERETSFTPKSVPEDVTVNVRWVLYHVLEHLGGHYGQILLLRHQYRDALKRAGAPD